MLVDEQAATDAHEREEQREVVAAVLDLLVDEAREVGQQLVDTRVVGEARERGTLRVAVVTLDGLRDVGVIQLHLLREHVLDERLAVHGADERFVLDGRAATGVVLAGFVLRDERLHAVDREPVHVERGLHGDGRQRRVQQLAELEFLVVREEEARELLALPVAHGAGRAEAVERLQCIVG